MSNIKEHTLPDGTSFGVEIQPLRDGDIPKCPRCWQYNGIDMNFMKLCDRCCKAITEGWPDHGAVPHIKAAYVAQQEKFKRAA